VEIVERLAIDEGFVIPTERWIVARTLAWTSGRDPRTVMLT
jgi:hypothetical protein